MKLALLLFTPLVSAFSPMTSRSKTSVELNMVASRREALVAGAATIFGLGAPAGAYQSAYQSQAGIGTDRIFADDHEVVPAQQPTGGKVDLNSAFVGEYKQFPGMFPSAAGKIASNGPYQDVKDVYKIKGLTAHDKEMIKKYEKEFTTLPASVRTFNERINARVST